MNKLNCKEFSDMCIARIRSGEASEDMVAWAGECMLQAYEDGSIDENVVDELHAAERAILDASQ